MTTTSPQAVKINTMPTPKCFVLVTASLTVRLTGAEQDGKRIIVNYVVHCTLLRFIARFPSVLLILSV